MQRDTNFMDWVDRVREQANEMAQKAQDVQVVGQTQWSELQHRRQIAALLNDLGEVTYQQQTLGESKARSLKARELVQKIRELEDELVIDLRDSSEKTDRQSSNANA